MSSWPLTTSMRSVLSGAPGSVPGDAAKPAASVPAGRGFEALYRDHFRFVWRTVRRLGIDGALTDDVVQEVFLVVHRRLDDFEGRSSPKTWLYGIVRRVIADRRRTQRRKPEDAAQLEPDALRSPALGPEASAEQAERVRLLHRLLAELGDDKREAFVLAELEGLSIAEIAEAIDANPNTVASRVRAARREFEAALERATQDDVARTRRIEEERPR